MRIPFRIVDVFTPRPLAGNQLCVVPEPVELDDELRQAVAREIGFSETTFVTRVEPDRYAMRIFTPGREMPFAGHPTLGTAFVLASEGSIGPRATQEVAAGEIPVEVDLGSNMAWMTQLAPRFGAPYEDRDLVARAAGLEPGDLVSDLPVQTVWTGLPHTLVAVRDPQTLARAARDERVVAEVLGATGADGMYLFAVAGDGVVARMFDADLGIGEDPATGSAAGPLAAFLAEHGLAGLPGRALVRQGEQVQRPSELHIEAERDGSTWRVRVGGGVHLVGRGDFEL